MNMDYKFINKDSQRTIVLLHDTGGNQSDLIFLGETIDKKANLLGLRGRIKEHGMNRFYKRIQAGVIDEDSLIEETNYLHKYLKAFAKVNQIETNEMILLGYSNGANLIASLIYHYGPINKAYILLHPSHPFKDLQPIDQRGNKVFITAGMDDQFVFLEKTEKLYKDLLITNAKVSFKTYSYGHGLCDKEIKDIKKWYKKIAIKN